MAQQATKERMQVIDEIESGFQRYIEWAVLYEWSISHLEGTVSEIDSMLERVRLMKKESGFSLNVDNRVSIWSLRHNERKILKRKNRFLAWLESALFGSVALNTHKSLSGMIHKKAVWTPDGFILVDRVW